MRQSLDSLGMLGRVIILNDIIGAFLDFRKYFSGPTCTTSLMRNLYKSYHMYFLLSNNLIFHVVIEVMYQLCLIECGDN